MHRMSENDYIISLLEQALVKLDEIEARLDKRDAELQKHIAVKHPFHSLGKRHANPALRDTQVPGRY